MVLQVVTPICKPIGRGTAPVRDLLTMIINYLLTEKRKNIFVLLLFESWLFNRDPYVMVYFNPHITGKDFIPYIINLP